MPTRRLAGALTAALVMTGLVAPGAPPVIRELDTETGIQRVVAGNGFDERNNPATLGDGGSARAASLG